MKFHKEGRATLILAIVFALILVSAIRISFPANPVFQLFALLVALFVLVTVLQFFRKPNRKMHNERNALIAPCDGKIVVIEDVYDEEYFKSHVKQVSIFMSPLNVHINWFPMDGNVVYSKYHKGKYLVAWDPKSSTDNERHSVVIRNDVFGEVLVKQIAGALARRIVNYAHVGITVKQGDELGFIKFGSRVDLLIPLNASIEVSLEQISIGGQTVIALSKQNG